MPQMYTCKCIKSGYETKGERYVGRVTICSKGRLLYSTILLCIRTCFDPGGGMYTRGMKFVDDTYQEGAINRKKKGKKVKMTLTECAQRKISAVCN